MRSIYFFFLSLGLDLLKLKNVIYIPSFIKNIITFKNRGGKIDFFSPVLAENVQQVVDKHYFLQDLYVAQQIFKKRPTNHLDIGSRIDGFVTHLATFRKVNVLDLRPIKIEHENIRFINKDLLKFETKEIFDSISCLHTIEHVGLGRYGDEINPNSYKQFYKKIIEILYQKGRLYISCPISKKNKVYFNSQRTFDPKHILQLDKSLKLIEFSLINNHYKMFNNIDINKSYNYMDNNSCGIYIFEKN
jgi:hypothetical protein